VRRSSVRPSRGRARGSLCEQTEEEKYMASTSGVAHSDAVATADASMLTFALLKKVHMMETKECEELKTLVSRFASVQEDVHDKLAETANMLRAQDAFAGGEGTSDNVASSPLLQDQKVDSLVESAAMTVSLSKQTESLQAAMVEARRTYTGLAADNVTGTNFKSLLEGIESRSIASVDPKQSQEFKDMKRKIMVRKITTFSRQPILIHCPQESTGTVISGFGKRQAESFFAIGPRVTLSLEGNNECQSPGRR